MNLHMCDFYSECGDLRKHLKGYTTLSNRDLLLLGNKIVGDLFKKCFSQFFFSFRMCFFYNQEKIIAKLLKNKHSN